MIEREQILKRAKSDLNEEVFSLFEKLLPQQGPFNEKVVRDALWEAVSELNAAHPVKIPDIEFLSPVLEFEISAPVPTLDDLTP